MEINLFKVTLTAKLTAKLHIQHCSLTDGDGLINKLVADIAVVATDP